MGLFVKNNFCLPINTDSLLIHYYTYQHSSIKNNHAKWAGDVRFLLALVVVYKYPTSSFKRPF